MLCTKSTLRARDRHQHTTTSRDAPPPSSNTQTHQTKQASSAFSLVAVVIAALLAFFVGHYLEHIQRFAEAKLKAHKAW